MKKAMIMEIQRYSVHDGPGIRSTVFFKGCHLSCPWCHNPESQKAEQEILFYPELCVGCGACGKFCPGGAVSLENGVGRVDVKICRSCEKKQECVENCPAQAIKICGSLMTVDEVFSRVLQDRGFYGSPSEPTLSRGGITCSGGEPLLQGDFVAELLRRCVQEGVSTCVDTTLNLDWHMVEQMLPYTDLFLVDLKFMRESKAIEYTGVGCERVIENLKRLGERNHPVIVRIPLAPGVNDSREEEILREKLLAGLPNVLRVDRFTVTNHAAKKYRALQRDNWLAKALNCNLEKRKA